MLRLRRLEIHEFRGVKPGTELRFHDGVHVLLGKNGAGKSTLLDLVSMALRLDFHDIQAEDYDIEFDVDAVGQDDTRSMIARVGTRPDAQDPDPAARIRRARATRGDSDSAPIFDLDGTRMWRSSGGKPGDALQSCDERLGLLPLYWACMTGQRIPDVKSLVASDLAEDRIHALSHGFRYTESIDIFMEILRKMDIRAVAYLDDPEDDAMRRRGLRIIQSIFGFTPTHLIELVQARVDADPDATELTFTHEDLPFLGEFKRLCGLASASLTLTEQDRTYLKIRSNAEVKIFAEPTFRFTRKAKSAAVGPGRLSHGQKRLLGLLYYLDTNPAHLVADELANSLDHDWIAGVMAGLGSRQVFLSSPNLDLLGQLRFDSPGEVQKTFVLCERNKAGQMLWRNMSDNDAGALYEAFAAGIGQVGAFLGKKGLW